MPLLVDTGILYALADRRDAWHRRVVAYLTASPQSLLAPATVLPEVTYLLRERIGAQAERAFVSSVARGEIAVTYSFSDWARRCKRVQSESPALCLLTPAGNSEHDKPDGRRVLYRYS